MIRAGLALMLSSLVTVVLGSCQESSSVKERSRPPAAAVSAWTAETVIGKIVAERPQTARIFDLVGIDYCCGGKKPLGLAAAEQQADIGLLLSALAVVGAAPGVGADRNWSQAELKDLVEHIVSTHHQWLRRNLPSLLTTARTVLKVHGAKHPELTEVIALIEKVHAGVLPHLDDEEQRVFPALVALSAGEEPAGVSGWIDELHDDHDELRGMLHRLRDLTKGFAVPANACAKYREMLSGLAELERDMHTHVHLENNVLLPRARSLLAERK